MTKVIGLQLLSLFLTLNLLLMALLVQSITTTLKAFHSFYRYLNGQLKQKLPKALKYAVGFNHWVFDEITLSNKQWKECYI